MGKLKGRKEKRDKTLCPMPDCTAEYSSPKRWAEHLERVHGNSQSNINPTRQPTASTPAPPALSSAPAISAIASAIHDKRAMTPTSARTNRHKSPLEKAVRKRKRNALIVNRPMHQPRASTMRDTTESHLPYPRSSAVSQSHIVNRRRSLSITPSLSSRNRNPDFLPGLARSARDPSQSQPSSNLVQPSLTSLLPPTLLADAQALINRQRTAQQAASSGSREMTIGEMAKRQKKRRIDISTAISAAQMVEDDGHERPMGKKSKKGTHRKRARHEVRAATAEPSVARAHVPGRTMRPTRSDRQADTHAPVPSTHRPRALSETPAPSGTSKRTKTFVIVGTGQASKSSPGSDDEIIDLRTPSPSPSPSRSSSRSSSLLPSISSNSTPPPNTFRLATSALDKGPADASVPDLVDDSASEADSDSDVKLVSPRRAVVVTVPEMNAGSHKINGARRIAKSSDLGTAESDDESLFIVKPAQSRQPRPYALSVTPAPTKSQPKEPVTPPPHVSTSSSSSSSSHSTTPTSAVSRYPSWASLSGAAIHVEDTPRTRADRWMIGPHEVDVDLDSRRSKLPRAANQGKLGIYASNASSALIDPALAGDSDAESGREESPSTKPGQAGMQQSMDEDADIESVSDEMDVSDREASPCPVVSSTNSGRVINNAIPAQSKSSAQQASHLLASVLQKQDDGKAIKSNEVVPPVSASNTVKTNSTPLPHSPNAFERFIEHARLDDPIGLRSVSSSTSTAVVSSIAALSPTPPHPRHDKEGAPLRHVSVGNAQATSSVKSRYVDMAVQTAPTDSKRPPNRVLIRRAARDLISALTPLTTFA